MLHLRASALAVIAQKIRTAGLCTWCSIGCSTFGHRHWRLLLRRSERQASAHGVQLDAPPSGIGTGGYCSEDQNGRPLHMVFNWMLHLRASALAVIAQKIRT